MRSEPDDDEFEWSKFTNQDSEPQEQPEPPSNQGVTEQFKAAMATTTAISQPSAARVNYTGTMTIYRGGSRRPKYGFDQDKGLPKVIEQTISAPDTIGASPEPTLTVNDDSADSTNGVDPEGTIEQAP